MATSKSTGLQDQADDFSLRLHHLTNIANLAAFACEARRVLEGVSEAVQFRDEMRDVLQERIRAMNSWSCMPDTTGDVLKELAKGLEALNTEWTAAIYEGDGSPKERTAPTSH